MNAAAISTTNLGNDTEAQKALLPGFSFTLFRKDKGILTKRMKLADGQLAKDINMIVEIKDVAAQEVIREGIALCLEKLEKDQAEFIKRMARR